MLPTNGNETNCNPISSNCVIWQGPDITCLNLCKGETVSAIVADLGNKLCDMLDLFDIKNYDLTCLSNCPKVEDIQELIQLIITNLCQLQDCCDQTPSVPGTARNIDTVIPVAACFYYRNPQGDIVTEMKVVDYATAAGNQICTITAQITSINSTLVQHNTRITTLEDKPEPVFVIPEITPVCVMPAVPTPIDQVLSTLESKFCQLVSSTGVPNSIYQSVAAQCAGLTADRKLGPGGGQMSSISGWKSTVQNLSDSFTNVWLTLCDIRAAVKNIQANCCPTGCSDVTINLSATLVGTTLRLFFTGTIPAGFLECSGSTLVTVQDTDGSSISFSLPLASNMNDPSGYPVDTSVTPLNTALNFTISTNVCLDNDTIPAQCQTYVQYILLNSMSCPSPVTITPTTDSMSSPATSQIEYSFPHTGGSLRYTVQLYNGTGSVLLQSQSTSVTGPTTVSGTFTGLTPSTTYRTRISMAAGEAVNSCPFESTATPAA